MIAEGEEKMVYIVGIGPGNREYMLNAALTELLASDCIIGFKRAVESVAFIQKPKYTAKNLKNILDFIQDKKYKKICVIASGDPLFYGVAEYVKKNYIGDIKIIPGISSFQYMMSKLGKSWQNAKLSSLHGREQDFIKEVEENKTSIWLTDNKNTPDIMCKNLVKANIKAHVYIGENLSYEDEKISCGEAFEFIDKKFKELTVVVIENDNKR
ncbi:precorrin-6y C5,15-methyltransferase (decarboxylating) subunit CbiE [Clostridium acidisoli]|nr:precorrin-6y C5,15-methyltransferase (decarboxylating) subunit CbiE [Clostridium acidisoli]